MEENTTKTYTVRDYRAEDLFLIEGKIFPNDNQVKFLEKVVRGGMTGLPWYKFAATDDRYPIFSHPIVDHPMDNNTNIPGVNCSEFSEVALSIVRDFCTKNNLKIKYFITSNVVCSRPQPGEIMGDIHLDFKDLDFYHFILYINQVKKGSTYLFDREKRLIKEIPPEMGKAIIFKTTPHAQGFCDKHENRYVLTATFKIE